MPTNKLPITIRIMAALGLVNIRKSTVSKPQESDRTTPTLPKGFNRFNTPVNLPKVHKTNYLIGLSVIIVFVSLVFTSALWLAAPPSDPIQHEPLELDMQHVDTDQKLDSDELMIRYPSPRAMQDAINSGELDYYQIPDEFHRFVEPRAP